MNVVLQLELSARTEPPKPSAEGVAVCEMSEEVQRKEVSPRRNQDPQVP